MKHRSTAALWTVYGCISLYSMAFMAQVPVLPYLLQDMGAKGSMSYGALQTAFSLAQMVGGFISGPLLDRWGGRAMLMISLGSAVANYAFTASATSLSVLYVSRVFTIMQHALLAARAFVAGSAGAESRVRLLSYLSVANSVGFAAGPFLGGYLTQYGIRTTAWASTFASLLSVVAVAIMVPGGNQAPAKSSPASVPESPDSQDSSADDDGVKAQAARKQTSWMQPLQVLRYPAVKQLMLINLVYNIAYGLNQSVFALMLRNQYSLDSKHNGMVLSYQGALGMVCQALLVEPARRRLGEGGAIYASIVAMVCAYLFLAATSGSVTGLLLALVGSAAGSGTLSTVLTAQLTRAGPQHVVGSVLALDMSLFAAVRLFTPAAGTALLEMGGAAAIGCAAAGLLVLLLLFVQLGWVRCDGGLPPIATKEISIIKSRNSHDEDSNPGPGPNPGPDGGAQNVIVLANRQNDVGGVDNRRGSGGGLQNVGPSQAWVRWAARGGPQGLQRSMQFPLRA